MLVANVYTWNLKLICKASYRGLQKEKKFGKNRIETELEPNRFDMVLLWYNFLDKNSSINFKV